MCPDCKVVKPRDDYYKNRASSSGYQSYCKECSKARCTKWQRSKGRVDYMKLYHIKRAYGLSFEEYDAMVERQNGACAICHEKPKSFHTDHCHDTGRVRGLLCAKCNLGISHFDGKPDWLAGALKYLGQPQQLSIFNGVGSV